MPPRNARQSATSKPSGPTPEPADVTEVDHQDESIDDIEKLMDFMQLIVD